LAMVASIGIRRTGQRGLRWAMVVLGLTLFLLNLWLMSGPSPGLIVSSLGIALLILGPVVGLVRGGADR